MDAPKFNHVLCTKFQSFQINIREKHPSQLSVARNQQTAGTVVHSLETIFPNPRVSFFARMRFLHALYGAWRITIAHSAWITLHYHQPRTAIIFEVVIWKRMSAGGRDTCQHNYHHFRWADVVVVVVSMTRRASCWVRNVCVSSFIGFFFFSALSSNLLYLHCG